jgi:serpin B
LIFVSAFLFLKIEQILPKIKKPTSTSSILNSFPTLTLIPTTSTSSTFKDYSSITSANNQFNLDLYKNLIQKEKSNIFFSPYSIFSAMAMVYEGALGKTAEEIKAVFHFPETNILRNNFYELYSKLNQKGKDFELKTVNALWLQKDYPFLSSYLALLEKYYGGKARNLDFVNETEKSRQIINQYIEEETNKKIKNLIPEDSISPMTRLVLTNAIYFKGVWLWNFDEKMTNNEKFFIRPDFSVEVPVMNMPPEEAEFNYYEDETVQVLELPYKGGKIMMIVVLPRQILSDRNLLSFESSLTEEKLKAYQTKMEKTKLDAIALPKFKLRTNYFLNENLIDLGMPTAFSERADFSKITGKKDFSISTVIHQAFVEVDEKGTEAAATTAAFIFESMGKIFRADHPFLFYILDKETGTILFFGRVVDPRG